MLLRLIAGILTAPRWRGPPVVALSVDRISGKEEYQDSQFSARILSDANITIAIQVREFLALTNLVG